MISAEAWPAPAKINLFLHVVGRRPDGYHLLQTIFQFLDYGDALEIAARGDGEIRRLNDLPGVPPEQDLVVRAARLLQAATGTSLGAEIRVHKRLPLGGGLGGGSSNAATVLVALNALWGTQLAPPALAALGLRLGADVPVFIHGHAAWAEGVGEALTPIDVPEPWYVVIHPGCHVPTAAVFSDPELTRNTPVSTIRGLSLATCHNDCEPVTCRLFPEVARALAWLGRHAPARMSGTGACIFAPFELPEAAREVAAQVPAHWTAFVAAGCNRSPLLARAAAAGVPGA
ncbi:MAG: 4-(cytidine 5'-diphospho)-2-C-methyl-D-erythritol kinase [Gammaproteobacteria bacterium]